MNVLSYQNPIYKPDSINVWPHQIKKSSTLISAMVDHRNGGSVKLDARKLAIAKIDIADARTFLEAHHLSGYANSSFKYGLVHPDHGLVFLVTLGKPRFAKNFDLEVIRLASKSGFIIRGGASRLFSHIKKNHAGFLLSYSDRMLGGGGVYKSVGFTHIGRTGCGYFWEKDGEILHRFQTQKHKLPVLFSEELDLRKSETELMHDHGWRRVSDFGNDRWALEMSPRPVSPYELQYHYTYRITRTTDGAYYLGVHSTNDLDDDYFGSGNLICRSIKRHGKLAHTKVILEQFPSRLAASEAEKQLITIIELRDPNCLNISLGGGTPLMLSGTTIDHKWIYHPSNKKELFVHRGLTEIYVQSGWILGRAPGMHLQGITGSWFVDESGKQSRGEIPFHGKRVKLRGTTTDRIWVSRNGIRKLTADKADGDLEGFSPSKTNKGKKVLIVNGVRKLFNADEYKHHISSGAEKPKPPTLGRIGMRSPTGEKKLVLLAVARVLASHGWVLASTQLKSAPAHVLEFAAELGLKLPTKRIRDLE